MDLTAEVGRTPDLPDFSQFAGEISLPRRLRVASPCAGLLGCSRALQFLNVGADSINVFDVEDEYYTYICNHLASTGMDPSDIRLHLGRPVGDVTQVDLRSLERPVDVLAVGPPCPPWSVQGKHMGKEDMRAQ
eukprot:2616237-Pyramimonas_sp.AAC.1